MSNQVQSINQLKVFVNTINDLSADLILQESLNEFNKSLYNEKIEEALVEYDEEKFNYYVNLLGELTQ